MKILQLNIKTYMAAFFPLAKSSSSLLGASSSRLKCTKPEFSSEDSTFHEIHSVLHERNNARYASNKARMSITQRLFVGSLIMSHKSTAVSRSVSIID